MALKHFTDASTRSTVGINSNNVVYVRERNHLAEGGCIVYFVNGMDLKIVEPYLEVVASLNTK